MAKAPVNHPGVDIAALKKKVVQQSNLMQSGTGTPWEDRGSLGVIKAFFLTCIQSITNPAKLWNELSRPETTRDATSFAGSCGLIVGISWVVHSLRWDLFHSGLGNHDGVPPFLIQNDPRFEISWNIWALGSALQLAIAIFGTILMLRFANAVYQKLVPHVMTSRIPPSLSYNVLAYSLGPVLFVLLPMWGWLLALLWVWALFMYVGIRRLTLGAGAGIISGVLTMLVVTVVGFGAYFAGDFAWDSATGTAVNYSPPLPPGTHG